MPPSDGEILAKFFNDKLFHQRIDVITQYTESPLRLGQSREYNYFDIIFPVQFIGPTFKPVPGGAGVTLAGVPKFPYRTSEAIDVISNFKENSETFEDSISDGTRLQPDTDNTRWHYDSQSITLAAGAVVDSPLVSAVANHRAEIWLDHVTVSPVENNAKTTIDITLSAASGATGMITAFHMHYLNTVAPVMQGLFSLTFPNGRRVIADVVDEDIDVTIINGFGVEVFDFGFYFRYVPA